MSIICFSTIYSLNCYKHIVAKEKCLKASQKGGKNSADML